MERDLIEKTLDVVMAEVGAGVKFVNVSDYLDKGRIDETFKTDPESPLLVVGLDDERWLAETNSKLEVVFARPKTVYVKLPCKLEVLQEAVKKIKITTGQVSVVLEKKVQIEETEKQVRYLRHRHLDGGRVGDSEAVGREARAQYGWKGTDEEIMTRLQNFHSEREMALQFSDQIISGVFCDVEGTLLDLLGEKTVQMEVLEMLKKHENEGKSVVLWSGGDPKEIGQELKAVGINQWPILSKYDFRGCVVEVAIDDVPAVKLLEDYGIKAEVYVHHDPDGAYSL